MNDLSKPLADPRLFEQPVSGRRIHPINAFIEFKREKTEQSIPDCFEQQVCKYSDRLAVRTRNYELTYDALNQAANRVARAILAQRGKREEPIALLLEHDAPLIAAILGVLKAGKIYVPLDPSFPYARNSYILEDSQASLVVTSNKNLSTAHSLTKDRHQLINIDEIDPHLSTENLGLSISPDNLAYILYTSGSTGQPKGVVQNHRNVLHVVMRYTNGLHVSADDRLSLLSSCNVTASVSNLFGALLNRASLFPYNVKEEGLARLADWLVQEEITVYHSVPTLFRHFVNSLVGEEKFPKLRLIRTGGEPVYKKDVELYKRYFSPDCIFVNGYGASEMSTVWEYCIDKNTEITGALVPVGYLLDDITFSLLDAAGEAVGFNRVGEIAIKSCYLSPGYWRKPDLTQAAFLPDPQGGNERIYRTGDLGYMLPDGCLVHVGRQDFQVKIRGYRVEVAEIELAILDLAAIKEAVVVAREDQHGDKHLVAYVVPHQEETPTISELRGFLKEKLPEYMVPSAFVMLDELPLTPNGKVDRRALPAPDQLRPELEGAYVAPRTPVEEVVAGIWAEVLGLEQVGIYDNFFELGGHSLLATQVISRVNKTFEADIQLRALFESPTVAGLSALIVHSQTEALSEDELTQVLTVPALEATADAGPAELSFSQQRLWVLDQIEPGGAAYIIAGALELRGALAAPVLERALGALVHRHEALRTLFVNLEGEPLQVVSERGAWTLPVADLSGEVDARERLRTLLREEASRGFDLARGPLFRARLYRLAPDTHVLLLAMHHIISDGWSMGVLVRELGELYGRFARGEGITLPVLSLQYRDFARWQRSWLEGEALERLLSHWRSRLEGAPQVLELPADRPRPAVESHRGASYSFRLPLELAQALRGLARREGATLFMTLLSGFTLLLSRYSGQQDLLVGTPIANRSRAEIEDMVGFFVNTLVLRADLSGDLSASQFLARLREVCLDAYTHQDLPFERLVEEMRPERDLSRNPLFQVMFALQNAPQRPLELPGLTLSPVDVERGAAQFDLTLHMRETAEGLSASFNYATDLFDEPAIARMATHLRLLLEGMTATPERCVWELPLLTDAERHQLLVEWNDTAADYPADALLHELIEAQTARTPDAVAVVSEDQRLTYRELDARANQLAHYLQKCGVGPDTLVPICIERSIEMVIGILGVLKAGGAYVPIDPEYPRQRIAYMLEEVQSPVVLTQHRLRAQLPLDLTRTICLDTDWEAIAGESASPASSPATASNIAYVIYTSGSTGRPKGVMVPHAGICNHMFWMQRAHPLERADVGLQKTPFGFDASVWEFFAPLLAGARLVVARPGGHLDPAYLADAILLHRVSILKLVPSQLCMLLKEPTFWCCAPPLTNVYCGGEPLTRELCEEFYRRLPRARLHNLYGPTETSIDSTSCDCPDDGIPAAIPIGRPIDNTRTYIVNPRMQPSPIGVPGELLVGGAGLARGYLNEPGLTAEKFVPDPFRIDLGARVYKTGDLARFLPDGNIEFLGRLDHQVKIRGFRIELGEIEANLAEHPDVRQAAVYLWTVKADDARIVACCVPAKAGVLGAISLRKHLRARLPEYMVPQYFLPVDEIPLTPNGKVDRRRLPTPVVTESGIGRHEAPADPIEATIAEIWTQLIHPARPIGRIDKFFEMGGHSLLGIKALRQIEVKLGVRLDFRLLFHENLADIATRCRSERIAGEGGQGGVATGRQI